MEGFESCLGELEEMVKAVGEAGLTELVFRSPRGSLVLRGVGCARAAAEDAYGGAPAAGDGSTRLLLLRSGCVGRWSRAVEDGPGPVVEKGASLGTISTLLGEELIKAPGPGRVEKWVIGEGDVAGFGDPLALFREVV